MRSFSQIFQLVLKQTSKSKTHLIHIIGVWEGKTQTFIEWTIFVFENHMNNSQKAEAQVSF